MAKNTQTRVNKNYQDKLLYSTSFNNLADGTIRQFEATGPRGAQYVIKINEDGKYGVYDDPDADPLYGPFDSVESLKSSIPNIVNKIK